MTDARIGSSAIDRSTSHRIGKLLLAAFSLILLSTLASLLPGVDRLIPGSSVTFVAVIGAIVTVAVVGILLSLAPAFATLVRSTLDGPEPVVDDVAVCLQLLVVFVAMVVAHRGLAPAIVPLLDGLAWTYDVVFFALALPPLAILAMRLYVSLDPMAELLSRRATRSSKDESPDETG